MHFDLDQAQTTLRAQARSFANRAIEEHGRHHDSWINGFSREVAVGMSELGWIGLTWPKEFGGGGRPPVERLIIAEELIAAGAPIASMWFADRQIGPSFITYGTDEQRSEYLPAILAGDVTWCLGMSEPDSGSDLASLSTTAIRDGDDWLVTGQKIWTSFGSVADYCYLICRTSTDGPAHRGISELVVPMDSPGIEVRPITDMVTNTHFCEVFFDQVRIPAVNLVGTEGGAFRQTMRQLEHERGGIDRLVSNRWLYDLALERADLTDERVRQQVARLETGYRLGRMLVYREVLGQAPSGFSAATKCFCTEHEQRVADFVSSVFGAAASIDERVVRAQTYAPAYTIMGGTSNVMRNIVAERVLGLPRGPR